MDISAVQILIVLVIALLVFGPKRLPELGRQVGRGVREMKRQVSEVTDDFTSVRDDVDEFRNVANDANSRRPSSTTAATVTAAAADETDEDILDGVVVDGSEGPTVRTGDSAAG